MIRHPYADERSWASGEGEARTVFLAPADFDFTHLGLRFVRGAARGGVGDPADHGSRRFAFIRSSDGLRSLFSPYRGARYFTQGRQSRFVMASFFRALLGRDPSGRLQDGARKWAQTDLSDADAVAALAEEISDISPRAIAAEIDGWHPRDDIRNDRAYRLLVGVRDGGTVPPVDPKMRDQFAREEELGRVPLFEAMKQVCGEFADEVNALADTSRARGKASLKELNKLQRKIDSRYGELARDIAIAYVIANARGRDPRTTYFDGPLRERHGTISGGLHRGSNRAP